MSVLGLSEHDVCRTPDGGRLLIPLAEIRSARARIADVAIRTPLVRLQAPESHGRDLAQARVPAADRLVQDPWRGQRDPVDSRPVRSRAGS